MILHNDIASKGRRNTIPIIAFQMLANQGGTPFHNYQVII